MWSLLRCYLTGHDYGVSCEQGSMFLRCLGCGRRSQGWVVRDHASHDHADRL